MKPRRLPIILGAALMAASCKGEEIRGAGSIELSISAFGAGEPIPIDFTCDGADRSPALEWTDPPPGTQSFALIVDDPDAPRGVFTHWGAYDIDGEARRLDAGAGNETNPEFRQARNDFGTQGYRGPCPPRGHGAHRYRFKLFALDVAQLETGAEPQVADLEKAMRGHILGEADVSALYERS